MKPKATADFGLSIQLDWAQVPGSSRAAILDRLWRRGCGCQGRVGGTREQCPAPWPLGTSRDLLCLPPSGTAPWLTAPLRTKRPAGIPARHAVHCGVGHTASCCSTGRSQPGPGTSPPGPLTQPPAFHSCFHAGFTSPLPDPGKGRLQPRPLPQGGRRVASCCTVPDSEGARVSFLKSMPALLSSPC